jgi:4-amino-4-deoxy-L-arabinose transferase-like glycosyltransferase
MSASVRRTAASASAERSLVQVLGWVLALLVVVRLGTLGAYPLFDKTEARYAFIGELMLASGNWITPFVEPNVPFWAKPPLSMWLTTLSYIAFGLNEFAARLPSFLLFAAIAYLVFAMAMRERGKEFALIALGVFASTALTFYLAGSIMTDPALVLGVTMTMVAFWHCVHHPSRAAGILFFVGLAVSLLAKGPIGVVLPGLAIGAWVAWHRKWAETWHNLPWIMGTLLTAIIALPWYALAESATPGFLNYFIIGEHFGRFLANGWTGDLYGGPRARPYGTIWLYGLLATLPWSLIVLVAPFHRRLRGIIFSKEIVNDAWLSYLVLWSIIPLLFFTMPRGVLIAYVAPSLPAFALLMAYVLTRFGAAQHRLFIPATVALVPAVFVVFVLAARVGPLSTMLPSQAGVIETYERRSSGSDDYNLVYIFDKPYSADFYSRGRAKLAKDTDEVKRWLQNEGDPLFAVLARKYSLLPAELRGRLEKVAELNATVLLRPPPAPANARRAVEGGR